MGRSVILANNMSSRWQLTKGITSLLLLHTALLVSALGTYDSTRLSKDFPRYEVHKLLSPGIRSSKCSQVMTTRELSPALALQIHPSLCP